MGGFMKITNEDERFKVVEKRRFPKSLDTKLKIQIEEKYKSSKEASVAEFRSYRKRLLVTTLRIETLDSDVVMAAIDVLDKGAGCTGLNYFGQQIAGAVVQVLDNTGAAQPVQKVPRTDCISLKADLTNAGVEEDSNEDDDLIIVTRCERRENGEREPLWSENQPRQGAVAVCPLGAAEACNPARPAGDALRMV
ncbi:hypothetical protein E3N88_09750 [Mikania micrantha]|uniref:Uncharacterized protein n=1 Tax=Mikania micrantha TaxID=192012 RepID=A0A5N6PK06_9ASTR|nr:hypothetical protein E3N88_09750 [Mikania micrantha]